MSGATDLKKDSILPLEQNFTVIETPRHVHRAVSPDKVFPRGRDIHRSL